MSIAALLERARAHIAAEHDVIAFGVGDGVLNAEGIVGRVAFVEDGWVHWVDKHAYVYASRPDALRRVR